MKPSAEPRWIRRSQAWLQFVFRAERMGRFMAYTAGRFAEDGCPQKAAGLAYVSLLSLVPLLAIALGVLSAFPAFDDVRDQLQGLIFESFLPETSSAVVGHLTSFVENAGKATGPGIIAFSVTAILLLNNINGALNEIWRVPDKRPLALRILVYWALLSLGPILLGASLSLSGYVYAAVEHSAFTAYASSLIELSRLISVLLSTVGFALLYFIVPNRAVHPGHALFGAFIAALAFELLKAGFGFYIRSFGSYQAVYGALSTIPVFLLWMYLSWALVLVGAEIAAALPEWRAAQARGHHSAGPGERLALALGLLGRLYARSQDGGALRERALIQGLPATPAEIDATLRLLRKGGVVVRSMGGRWVLSRDMAAMSLGDLAELLGLGLEPGKGWPKPAGHAIATLAEISRQQLDISLQELLELPESDEAPQEPVIS